MSATIKFFVVIRGARGQPVAFVGEDEQVILYDSEEQARKDVENVALAQAYGYEVFPWESR